MKSPENEQDMINKEKGIATGEISAMDRLQNQIRLATDLYKKKKGEIDLNLLENRNEIMTFWSESSKGYSAAYRRMENSSWFKNHAQMNGDISKITIGYLEEFMKLEETGSI